jgi:hypothetical protein
MKWTRATVSLAATGFVFGPILDAIHTYTGTTRYAHPILFKSTWWCPPLFAGAALAIGLGRPLAERRLRLTGDAPTRRVIWWGVMLFTLAYLLSGFLPLGWLGKSLFLGPIFIVAWLSCDRTSLGLVLAGLSALGGWAVECGLVHAGAFFHRDTELAGVAGWIPLLYAIGSIAIGNLGKRLVTV